ncbi:DUF6348 family protein [Saccharothrix sp. HUAS TT1]|uniref:DUF6348 family protein n=1 Tax=unclassified Saccharothrix TaxID=2593673 RepID=UPI00345C4840
MLDVAIDRNRLLTALATGLSDIAGAWSVDGGVVRTEGSPVVLVEDLHGGEQPAGHVDVGFAFNPEAPGAPVLWDCAVGFGGTPAEVAEQAARTWLSTTAPALLELLAQRGELADHISGDDPVGLPGHHVIHGPIQSWGLDPVAMRDWTADHPLAPALRDTLPAHLDQPVNGVKLIFGGSAGSEVVEARVNGVVRPDVTEALRALDWPRGESANFARAFLVVLTDQQH